MATVERNGWSFVGRTATAVDAEIGIPMNISGEELDKMSMDRLLVLLNPIWWWRAILVVANFALADSIKLSTKVAKATGVLEIKFLELRRWMLIIQTTNGVRAQFVRLTKDAHVVDENTGRALRVEGYHLFRREAIVGLLKIVAVKEEYSSSQTGEDEQQSHTLGYRRGHYRNVAMCRRAALQVPPAELGFPDRRNQGYTWVHQVNPN